MKAGEFEPWQCAGLCSSDLKPDQVRTRRGHTEGQYDWGALSTRTLMTLLRDRSEYLTAHTQCFYKTYWNLANFCLYDCLSIHIHQILAPSSSSAQQSSFHSLFGGPSPTAGLTSFRENRQTRQTRQNRASGWTCFSGLSTWFNTPTAPTPFLAAVLLCRHWLLHGISSENLRGHWSAYMLRVDAWMTLQACKTSIS